MDKKCKKEVWHGWQAYPCKKRALDGSDFCGTHDPQRKAERAAKRGPTKFEREFAELARKAAEDEAMRSELESLRAENAALRERVAVLEAKPPRKKPKAHAKLIEVASRALPLMTCCPECGGCNLRRAQSELREALAAAKPAAQEGKEAP